MYKVLSNPSKYYMKKEITTKQLTIFKAALVKFEALFHKTVFSSEGNDSGFISSGSRADVSFCAGTGDSSNFENFNLTTKLSNFIENLNVGNIIPLRCGHSGIFDNKELETYQMYLYKAKFIN